MVTQIILLEKQARAVGASLQIMMQDDRGNRSPTLANHFMLYERIPNSDLLIRLIVTNIVR